MNNRSTLFSALLRLVPLKWQRIFEHSRMIKYYFVLRRFRKKVFLLGKQGTLFKKSMPFLFVATVSSLFYLLCLKIGLIEYFIYMLSKVGLLLGGRALSFFLIKMGCAGGLSLGIVLSIKALLIPDFVPFLTNMMLPSGDSSASSSEASVNQQLLIPQVNPPLLGDNIRRQQLNDRFGIHLFGLSHNTEVRDSFVETQLQIEKHIEGALVADGYSRESVLEKIDQIRGFLFYPAGKGLSETTYLKYLKEIRENGTRQSVPYRRIMKALQSYDLFLN
ncbi:hypothetical protein CsSME_00054649 [Camellia sinensis var. sinensis]